MGECRLVGGGHVYIAIGVVLFFVSFAVWLLKSAAVSVEADEEEWT